MESGGLKMVLMDKTSGVSIYTPEAVRGSFLMREMLV